MFCLSAGPSWRTKTCSLLTDIQISKDSCWNTTEMQRSAVWPGPILLNLWIGDLFPISCSAFWAFWAMVSLLHRLGIHRFSDFHGCGGKVMQGLFFAYAGRLAKFKNPGLLEKTLLASERHRSSVSISGTMPLHSDPTRSNLTSCPGRIQEIIGPDGWRRVPVL